jgi:hypothetical protein
VVGAAGLLALVPFVSGPFLRESTTAFAELSGGLFVGSLLGVGVLIAVTALLLAWQGIRLIRVLGIVLGVAAVASYAILVPMPRSALPRQFDLDQPPTFMRWLGGVITPDDRAFGIAPDFSSLWAMQDIETVGPLAPPEFVEFVSLISDEQTNQAYRSSTNFMLTGSWIKYDLGAYARARPILDWAGVRYLVLNKQSFNSSSSGRRDAVPLQEPPISLQQVYEDRRVYILASPEAQSKAELWSGYDVADDQAAILARLKTNPAAIREAPRVEMSQLPPNAPKPADSPSRTAVPIARYSLNEVELSFDASAGGLLVLKDVYAAGWTATIDGSPAPIVRVNGLVRGVFVPSAGQHTVRFTYLPTAFVNGAWLSVATAALLAIITLSAVLKARDGRRQPLARLAGARLSAQVVPDVS